MIRIKKSMALIILLLSVISVVSVFADENTTINQTININETINSSVSENNSIENNTIATFATIDENKSNNSSFSNETKATNITMPSNQTNNETTITLLKVFPDYIKLGDIQINLQIENSGVIELKNIEAQVTGNGFSTYETNEIESLLPKEKGYLLAIGNFKNTGNISLKIKIKESVFYSNVTVYDPFYVAIDVEKEKKLEEERKKKLEELSAKIGGLQKQYQQLENQLGEKKNDEYNVEGINLHDLKTYIRNTQASLAVADEKDSQANYVLAENEYNYQKEKIADLQKIKRSLKQTIVDNAVLISTIVGGLVAMITLVEIVRRQKERVSEKLKNIQLKKDTVEQSEQKTSDNKEKI